MNDASNKSPSFDEENKATSWTGSVPIISYDVIKIGRRRLLAVGRLTSK